MRISDWSSDVCSSDLALALSATGGGEGPGEGLGLAGVDGLPGGVAEGLGGHALGQGGEEVVVAGVCRRAACVAHEAARAPCVGCGSGICACRRCIWRITGDW